MKRIQLCIAAALVTVIAAGCATPGPVSGTEVTRFHRGDTIPAQAINLEPADAADAESLEFNTYKGIIADELGRLGYSRAEGDQADLLAIIGVSETIEIQEAKRSPFSIGFGGGSFGSSGGAGVSTSTNVGGSGGGEVVVTQLEVQLVSREERNVLWEGRAVRSTLPGSGEQPLATMQRLASALFMDFPGKSGSTVEVE